MSEVYNPISNIGSRLLVRRKGEQNYKNLPGVSSVPDLFGDPAEIDVTSITLGRTRTIPGVEDASALDFEFFWDNTRADSPYRTLVDIENNNEEVEFRLQYPDGTQFEWTATVFTRPLGFASGDALKFIAKIYVTSNDITIVNPESNIPSSFATDNWNTIMQNLDFYPVKAIRKIVLTNGEVATITIKGKDHDNKTGGGKAKLTIGFRDLLSVGLNFRMNDTNTNVGGYPASAGKTSVDGIIALLPQEIKDSIVDVDKVCMDGGTLTSVSTISVKGFLFSEREVTGASGTGYALEGEQYEYFEGGAADRVKTRNDVAVQWMTRSPYVQNDTQFRYIRADGTPSYFTSSNSYAHAVGFCIDNQ